MNLREERMNLWEEMKSLLTATEASGMNAEESEKYERMEAKMTELTHDIEARERAEQLDKRLNKPQEAPEGLLKAQVQPYLDEQRAYKKAFGKWVRGQDNEMTHDDRKALSRGRFESRDQSVGVGSAGGFLVPEEFSNKLFEHCKYFGAVRQVAGSVSTSSGADLLYPNMDDTSNVGAILAENATITEQDLAVGARTFKSWMYTSKLVQVSWQLMQDSAFDIEALLSRKLGERLGRIQNTHFTTGAGGFQPEGFVTNATTIDVAVDNTLSLSDVVRLVYSLDRCYRNQNAVFQMHDNTISDLRQEASTDGSFIWQPSAQAGEPDRLFGYPVWSNSDMANSATTTLADGIKVVAFGDFSNGYLIRDVKGVALVRLNERYADSLQTGFFAFMRVDGQPTFSSASTVPPYKVLKNITT